MLGYGKASSASSPDIQVSDPSTTPQLSPKIWGTITLRAPADYGVICIQVQYGAAQWWSNGALPEHSMPLSPSLPPQPPEHPLDPSRDIVKSSARQKLTLDWPPLSIYFVGIIFLQRGCVGAEKTWIGETEREVTSETYNTHACSQATSSWSKSLSNPCSIL